MTYRFSSGCPIVNRSLMAAGLSALLGVGWSDPVHAGAVIFNSLDPASQTVALGVNDLGHLNFFSPFFQTFNAGTTGLASLFPDGNWRDATAPGCLCEGWGLAGSLFGARVSGFANEASGTGGLLGGSFGATTTAATSVVSLAGAPAVNITHTYGVSLAPTVFQGNVTIRNTSTTERFENIVYRRAMDWDVPPTEFNEYVSHYGVEASLESAGGNLRFASNNGFASSDPEQAAGTTGSFGPLSVNKDFIDLGPEDHGSVFDFAFGSLEPGESRSFNIFYGAAPNEAAADAAISRLKPNLYSYGQSTSDDGSPNNDGTTYLFAFGGVGGVECGLTQSDPCLPFVQAPGQFFFPAPEPRRWLDPPLVSRYDYSLGSGEFFGFILPVGFTGFDLLVGGSTIASDLTSGTEYKFLDFGLDDVTAFSIIDISPTVDGEDPRAFPTFLDFTRGSSISMKAVFPDVETSAVPGPFPVLGLGAAFVFSRKLRKRIKQSSSSMD